ncbi:MAG TPA: hypothetical protein ENK62_03645, partial [Chromatiales bacterium]|nr:hypothetical protein [Chromatiales bacterium]
MPVLGLMWGSMKSGDSRGLVPAIRASLNAKLERLLRRPLIASVVIPEPPRTAPRPSDLPDVFRELDSAIEETAPKLSTRRVQTWREGSKDGTCSVRIEFDYEDLWRGRERDVLDAVEGTVEDFVTFLTDEQRLLLERAPRELRALNPRPECAELVAFAKEYVGGADRVQELTLAEAPKSPDHIRHIAIIPNLVPLERQLAALAAIEQAAPDGPLAPLRALLGLSNELAVGGTHGDATTVIPQLKDCLDAFQKECVRKALETPHFAVIQGPPGSGKTTVISTIIRHALDRGGRVLVVSPTHVAVDNVVEKLTPTAGDKAPDDLECRTLPVRFASRPKRLLEVAGKYWIGPNKRQRRAATLSRRVQRRLCEVDPVAKALFAKLNKEAARQAPLSQAIASVQRVICGTPIGILSFDEVKAAPHAGFDLLVVDEVSKMTLPEFLAVAVKARRWVLVGDPKQLPPYCDAEENGATLEDLLPPRLELVCSVLAYVEFCRPFERQDARLAVVCADPE